MPRLPSWAWLLLAVVFATLASYLALGWLKRQAAVQSPAKEKIVYVVRAKTQVEPYTPLQGKLKTDRWDQKTLPQDFFSDEKQVVERQAVTTLKPDELITRENTREKRGGITGLLSHNQRAMTVKVDEASGVAGFLTPGNRVDVVVIVSKGEYGKDPIAKLLFQNLKVLGTGQDLEKLPGDKPQIVPTVTLEVTPEIGEQLALAVQEGRISLVLRAQGDQQLVETQGVDASKLFGIPRKATHQAPPAAATASPPTRTVEMIRGLERAPVNSW
jgi:pilus assembly protein CpaB